MAPSGKGAMVRSPWAGKASAALVEHPFSLGHEGLEGFAERDRGFSKALAFQRGFGVCFILTPVIIATESSISCGFYS